jgi:aminoglycoside phosphotransferase (APT) family kinase protein
VLPHLSAYLRAILAVVQHDLAPSLKSSAYTNHRADLVQMMLLRLIADAQGISTQRYWSTLFNQLDGAVATQAAIPQPLRDALRRVQKEYPTATDQSDLSAILTAALAATAPAGANEQKAVTEVVRAIAAAEHFSRAAVETLLSSTRDSIGQQKTSREELIISEDVLTKYLRRRFPDQPQVRAANVTPLPGGRSKGTILFDFVSAERTEAMVIRKDFANDFMGCTVANEFPLVRAAWQAGLPVPEPYWLEEDASVIDGKFIVFARMAGRAAGTMFEMTASRAVARQLAAALAKLHSLDIKEIGIAGQVEFGSSKWAVRDMVLASYAKHRQNTSVNLLLESAHVWLLSNLNCVSPRAVLVHGDAGFHNVLADGDRMTALLDWELSHAGDPAEDLTSCKALAEKVMPWEEFMAAYIDNGGQAVSEERVRFFTIWKLLHYAMFASSARKMFESGVDPDLRLAAIGYNTFDRLQNNLARELSQAPS